MRRAEGSSGWWQELAVSKATRQPSKAEPAASQELAEALAKLAVANERILQMRHDMARQAQAFREEARLRKPGRQAAGQLG